MIFHQAKTQMAMQLPDVTVLIRKNDSYSVIAVDLGLSSLDIYQPTQLPRLQR
jgi:hypothetical protein